MTSPEAGKHDWFALPQIIFLIDCGRIVKETIALLYRSRFCWACKERSSKAIFVEFSAHASFYIQSINTGAEANDGYPKVINKENYTPTKCAEICGWGCFGDFSPTQNHYVWGVPRKSGRSESKVLKPNSIH